MKFQIKSSIVMVFTALTILSCSKQEEELTPAQTTENLYELVGTTTTRQATQEELDKLTQNPTERISCTLSSDIDCGDSPSSFEGYVQNCTTYPKIWPPTGATIETYKSMIYYVDSDGDINLDQYQDDAQDHVDELVNTYGSAAFITADVIYWPCRRGDNSCVIKYTVYK